MLITGGTARRQVGHGARGQRQSKGADGALIFLALDEDFVLYQPGWAVADARTAELARN